jgi:hypothetical protein
MHRKVGLTIITLVWLTVTSLSAQQRSPSSEPQQRQVHAQAQPPSKSVRPMYQRRDTWYEFLLKQFNPENLDYGKWIEQRRQAFLDARARNPYYEYSFGVTVALMLVTGVCAKLWGDHRRAMWITAEMMADLYNHDLYSRQVARQAIQRYNDHIERCNRAIESAGHGMHSQSGATTDSESLRAELLRVTDELASKTRENQKAQDELRKKAEVVTDLSMRLDRIGKRGADNAHGANVGDARSSESDLIGHVNRLQEQLCVERQKNRHLKGA